MKARTPCWPLFRNELSIDHYPGGLWVMGVSVVVATWLLCSCIPLLLLFQASEGNLATFFTAFGDLTGFALLCWLAIAGWLFAFAMLPGITNPGQNVPAFEFLFTRAVDRCRLLRVRTATVALVLLGPLVVNLLVAACRPAATFSPDPSQRESGAARQAQYERAFPHSQLESAPGRPPRLMIPAAALTLEAWILWLGTFCMLFMQGYCVLLAPHVQLRPWLAGTGIAAPVVAAFLLAPRLPRFLPDWFEQSFLFFARYPVSLVVGLLLLIFVVQRFSERKFNRLEIF